MTRRSLSLAAFFSGWAVIPALVVAADGILVVFWSYAELNDGIRWDQSNALVAYALANIAKISTTAQG